MILMKKSLVITLLCSIREMVIRCYNNGYHYYYDSFVKVLSFSSNSFFPSFHRLFVPFHFVSSVSSVSSPIIYQINLIKSIVGIWISGCWNPFYVTSYLSFDTPWYLPFVLFFLYAFSMAPRKKNIFPSTFRKISKP